MEKEIKISEVRQLCKEHQIQVKDLESVNGSFGKKIFVINQEFLLRMSFTSMTLEQEKFRRIATLNFVPKIIHTGIFNREAAPVYYTILTLLPGDDFENVYQDITETQQKKLGEDIARFLDSLQKIDGTQYDIGLYVPALPNFSGTWRDGHQEYWGLLKQESKKLNLKPDSIQVIQRAYRCLEESAEVLDFQTGPKLLHNDFHPKNIILNQGTFSGVIDWECSQFGEPDFELCHFIHWCLYPPKPNIDYRLFLRFLFDASPKCTRVPNLVRRLTIYQIEHELQQIIWNHKDAESLRVPRLVHWMDGYTEDLFREIGR